MKSIFAFVLFVFVSFGINAQNNDVTTEETAPAVATFNGGQEALMKFLSQNITYPISARENEVSGKVFVKFTVDVTGKISSAKIEKGVSNELDREAMRVVMLSDGHWSPAMVEGKPVNSEMMLPIVFALK